MTVNRGFPRDARLTRRAEFDRVFAEATGSKDTYLTVLARPNGLGRPRLGMVVSNRNAGGVVARNRIKRAVRESFRHRQYELNGLDIVVLAKPDVASATRSQLFASLERHWRRIIERTRRRNAVQ